MPVIVSPVQSCKLIGSDQRLCKHVFRKSPGFLNSNRILDEGEASGPRPDSLERILLALSVSGLSGPLAKASCGDSDTGRRN